MKTIRLSKTGVLKESMSFENIDYKEIAECDEWTESRLYELFTSRFLFVIFRETENILRLSDGKTEPEYKLADVKFWTMPQSDLAVAKDYWENIRECVNSNHISPEYFWSLKDDRMFHVRPKARVSADKAINPNGGFANKYCYWFNAKYVKEIIDNEL